MIGSLLRRPRGVARRNGRGRRQAVQGVLRQRLATSTRANTSTSRASASWSRSRASWPTRCARWKKTCRARSATPAARKLMDIRKVNYVILGGDNAGEHLLMQVASRGVVPPHPVTSEYPRTGRRCDRRGENAGRILQPSGTRSARLSTTMRTTFLRLLLSGAAASAALLAGCGGGDSRRTRARCGWSMPPTVRQSTRYDLGPARARCSSRCSPPATMRRPEQGQSTTFSVRGGVAGATVATL